MNPNNLNNIINWYKEKSKWQKILYVVPFILSILVLLIWMFSYKFFNVNNLVKTYMDKDIKIKRKAVKEATKKLDQEIKKEQQARIKLKKQATKLAKKHRKQNEQIANTHSIDVLAKQWNDRRRNRTNTQN